jgi:predicted TIM-barrel fold metal-dependent hydrolase
MKKLKKIDMHVHVIDDAEGALLRTTGDTFCTPAQLLELYDMVGVEHGVILTAMSPECADERNTNREIYGIVKRDPEHFSWFCGIDPRFYTNSADTDFSAILNHYKALGAKGVAELTCNLEFDDPIVMNLLSHAEKCEMPVTIHIGSKGHDYGVIDEIGLPRLEKILKTFPKLQIIGHSQKFWSEISGDVTEEIRDTYPEGKVAPGGRVPELLRKYKNLTADISAGSGYNAMARDPEFAYKFLEEFQDQLYYGTDICSPVNRTNPMLKLAAFLDDAMEQGKISYEAYEKISRGNALRLLGKA